MPFDDDRAEDRPAVLRARELCRTRPLIYSDLDHLKKGSTGFLHGLGFTNEEIALALDLELREVESNLKGAGFELDLKKILRFKNSLPSKIGDVINIRAPVWLQDDACSTTSAIVIQCIPKGEKCGLLVELLEDTGPGIPVLGGKKKGEEIVVPLDWYLP
ncbi:MAG: hypothetical protein PWP14_1439 [Methanolobus sp.]|nr:hypothetical protein [Methanolobus sp.]